MDDQAAASPSSRSEEDDDSSSCSLDTSTPSKNSSDYTIRKDSPGRAGLVNSSKDEMGLRRKFSESGGVPGTPKMDSSNLSRKATKGGSRKASEKSGVLSALFGPPRSGLRRSREAQRSVPDVNKPAKVSGEKDRGDRRRGALDDSSSVSVDEPEATLHSVVVRDATVEVVKAEGEFFSPLKLYKINVYSHAQSVQGVELGLGLEKIFSSGWSGKLSGKAQWRKSFQARLTTQTNTLLLELSVRDKFASKKKERIGVAELNCLSWKTSNMKEVFVCESWIPILKLGSQLGSLLVKIRCHFVVEFVCKSRVVTMDEVRRLILSRVECVKAGTGLTSPPTSPVSTAVCGSINENFQRFVEERNIPGIVEVAEDFVSTALTLGKLIIDEVNLNGGDEQSAVIKPTKLGQLGGRKYVVRDIMFKFAVDEERVFPDKGVDPNWAASKIAGHELKGLRALQAVRVKQLHFPLLALIDYKVLRASLFGLC